ncbi:MAG: hypothetical protein TEF_00295 [Rhizobiales bacterium NRL2]|jgi:hypothetical protein|nr:MAG: hypothetical protein TEF_00295 [Rhizobiales bacterium NRL2]
MPKEFQLALGGVVLLMNHAIAEPITSHSSKTWPTIGECWATLSPTVFLFIDEFGFSRLTQNSSDRIEHEVTDSVSGRVVLRAGCIRVPNSSPAIFRRYLEISN